MTNGTMPKQQRRVLLWVVLVLLCVAIVLAVIVVGQARRTGLPAIAAPSRVVLPAVPPHPARPA
jgi:hypothetical protein